MSKKMFLVSDFSGDILNPGEGVRVTLTFHSNGSKFELDAHEHEVESLIQAAHRKPKRKYTRKSDDVAQVTHNVA